MQPEEFVAFQTREREKSRHQKTFTEKGKVESQTQTLIQSGRGS